MLNTPYNTKTGNMRGQLSYEEYCKLQEKYKKKLSNAKNEIEIGTIITVKSITTVIKKSKAVYRTGIITDITDHVFVIKMQNGAKESFRWSDFRSNLLEVTGICRLKAQEVAETVVTH